MIEGSTEKFFGRDAFLSVSGQLSVENYAQALGDVYTFGPTFRAENSHTSRHLSEFWMVEPEMAFADLIDNMNCAEQLVKFCIKRSLLFNSDDLSFFDSFVENGLIKKLNRFVNNSFERLTYTDAINILTTDIKEKKVKFKNNKVGWGTDLSSEHERYLCEVVYGNGVIIYNYPRDIKSFYMRDNEDGKTCAAMDLLLPGVGELVGGSQREERLSILDKKIEEKGLNKEDYWWYRDLRKYGTCKHSGFGLGFDRLVMLVTGVENIRDVIPFPRYPGHCEF